jgi:hypothetical protein
MQIEDAASLVRVLFQIPITDLLFHDPPSLFYFCRSNKLPQLLSSTFSLSETTTIKIEYHF